MKQAMMCVLLCATSLIAQTGAKNGEWRTYGGDLGNTHYSPLDQINAGNFNKLEIAWRFKTDNLGPAPEYNLESTPLTPNAKGRAEAMRRANFPAADCRTGAMALEGTSGYFTSLPATGLSRSMRRPAHRFAALAKTALSI